MAPSLPARLAVRTGVAIRSTVGALRGFLSPHPNPSPRGEGQEYHLILSAQYLQVLFMLYRLSMLQIKPAYLVS
jgi:hypothetical protein